MLRPVAKKRVFGIIRIAGEPTFAPEITPQACVHALSAVCPIQGVVLAQTPITSTAEKTEAELTVAPALIAQLDWHGRVLTGDALFCQRHLCTQVLAAGGDYLFLAKGNQPELFDDVRLLFDPPMVTLPLLNGFLSIDRLRIRR